jgi:hypothetical protein
VESVIGQTEDARAIAKLLPPNMKTIRFAGNRPYWDEITEAALHDMATCFRDEFGLHDLSFMEFDYFGDEYIVGDLALDKLQY